MAALPVSPLTTDLINEELTNAGLLTQTGVAEPRVLDLGEIELLESLRARDGASAVDLLDEWQQPQHRELSLRIFICPGCGPCAVTVSVSARSLITAQGPVLKNARERMDVLAAYRDVGSYRGAAAICGTTHKTVKRIVERHEAGGVAAQRAARPQL